MLRQGALRFCMTFSTTNAHERLGLFRPRRARRKRILFDTGKTEFRKRQGLNVDLTKIDFAVISHVTDHAPG